jgi:hypothetical protein
MKALLLLLTATLSGAALADDAAILRCRAIAEVPARVACYDAMPLSSAGAAGRAAAPASQPAAAVQPAAPAAAAAVTTSANSARDFGLPEYKRRPADEPNAIESTIVGKFDGWGSNTRFRLANGQVWRVADGSESSTWERENPKVTISRNAIGTMFMEVEGSKLAPRVRREE